MDRLSALDASFLYGERRILRCTSRSSRSSNHIHVTIAKALRSPIGTTLSSCVVELWKPSRLWVSRTP